MRNPYSLTKGQRATRDLSGRVTMPAPSIGTSTKAAMHDYNLLDLSIWPLPGT